MSEDPEYLRFKRKYPKFPGVAKCVELLKRPNTGRWSDYISAELQDNASAHPNELIAEYRACEDLQVRWILLAVLCEAKLPEALTVFVEALQEEDDMIRSWAERGLQDLDTHDSRKALWNAGLH